MPWPGDPRINMQEGEGGKAKPYQIRQLLAAVDLLLAHKPPQSSSAAAVATPPIKKSKRR